jgi:ferrous iron transport protein B
MRLSDLKPGEEAVITRLHGYGAFRKRVMEMGFVKGRKIEAILTAPLNDPVKYRLMGYEISLRRNEAKMIEVATVDQFCDHKGTSHLYRSPIIEENINNDNGSKIHSKTHTINVALVGNPNCGKTSLFNIASGAMEHVGNYSGVTVDSKTGTFIHRGYKFNIVDLPGTYSLTSYSPEELYVRRYLRNQSPDVIINVVDSSNLERNLFLTTELIDMDRSMVVALNMFDELRNSGDTLDYVMLGKMIGVPIVPTVSNSGEGIDDLFDSVIHVFEHKHPSVRHIHVNLGSELENAVGEIKDIIKSDNSVERHFSPRYLAIKFLEQDKEIEEILEHTEKYTELKSVREKFVHYLQNDNPDEDIPSMIANEKYGFISGALAEVMEKSEIEHAESTKIIDAFVTNRLFGFPIFIAVMFFILWATFYIGAFPQEWIEVVIGWLGSVVTRFMPDGPLKDLITDGIIGGVGGVIVFLPNILILYFFISFMEDSGYMARAAFIMDKIMHRIGLHGKSFIPLLMGFGCNVPAIMATRSIESKSSRLITILINPFMSCSARLPIYVLLIGAFFEAYAALVFFLIYAVGITIAVITARLLRRTRFLADETPFVMELPPYRIPTFKATWRHMWSKCRQYLQKMGGIILLASIVVWALNYFPIHNESTVQDTIENQHDYIETSAIDPKHDSYLEMAGKFMTPVFEPLGFSWKATVAAVAGIPAKEIIVSTLGVLYTDDNDEYGQSKLGDKLSTTSSMIDRPDFTPASALAFLVFILLYCPCIATLTAIARETGSWKYVCFSIVYNTMLAWICAFLVFMIASLFV